MKRTPFIVTCSWLLFTALHSSAQTGLPAYADNALKYNRVMMEKTREGVYTLIGNFKVIGTPYLFGERNKGDLFSADANAYNIFLSYNTHSQEVEFYSTSNPDKPLIKEAGSLDSFIIQPNSEREIVASLKFIYGTALGSKEKSYFQEICKGDRFSFYKRYRSELENVSNYAQSEQRQFDLQAEYYYTDAKSKGIKKIKPNAYVVIKEFKEIKDLSADIKQEDFAVDPETAFCKTFSILNTASKGF